MRDKTKKKKNNSLQIETLAEEETFTAKFCDA
jgi:hypothetical protein